MLRPVSTKENKHQTGLFLSCIRVADHRFKLEQKIGSKSPCAASICSDLVRSDAYFPAWKSAIRQSKMIKDASGSLISVAQKIVLKQYLSFRYSWFLLEMAQLARQHLSNDIERESSRRNMSVCSDLQFGQL